jgi:hypothetical protein
MKDVTTYVGIDAHKKELFFSTLKRPSQQCAILVREETLEAEVLDLQRSCGRLPNTKKQCEVLILLRRKRLSRRSPAVTEQEQDPIQPRVGTSIRLHSPCSAILVH